LILWRDTAGLVRGFASRIPASTRLSIAPTTAKVPVLDRQFGRHRGISDTAREPIDVFRCEVRFLRDC
jgi:hypothetical protein